MNKSIKLPQSDLSNLMRLTSNTWRHVSFMIFLYTIMGVLAYFLYFSLITMGLIQYYWLRVLVFLPFALLELTAMFGVIVWTSVLAKITRTSVKEFNSVRQSHGLPESGSYETEINFSIMYAGIFCLLRLIILLLVLATLI